LDGDGGGGRGDIADGSTAAASAPAAGDGDDGPSDDARDLAISMLNDAKMATTAEAKVQRKESER
jgi:hypothetical protein